MSCTARLLRVTLLSLCCSAMPTFASAQALDVAHDHLDAGDRLLPGDSLTSASGRYWLVYQGDGNLVLYDLATGVALWWTGTVDEVPGQAVMQGDGNFVVYNADGLPVWWSATDGYAGARLFVQDDANVVVYAPDDVPVWWSAGSLRDVTVVTGQVFDAITGAPIAGAIVSLNGRDQTTTDAFGRYSLVESPIYEGYNFMVVSAENYATQYQYDVSQTFENVYLYPIDWWC
jgi:hypothetical protein